MELEISEDGGHTFRNIQVVTSISKDFTVWIRYEDGSVRRGYVDYWNPEWDTIEGVYNDKKVTIGLVEF
jgi:hypothetical protein